MKNKPKLLCVDDEPHVVDGLAVHLRKRYEVSTSTRPRDVVDRVRGGERFDVIVSDLRMPDVDGVHLLREIREIAPNTARILLTGYGDFSSAVAAVNEAAVHRFLTKPCRPDLVEKAIEEGLALVAPKVDGELGKLATLGTMAGSIGHEVGNLVSALSGSIDLVRAHVDRGELPSADEVSVLASVRERLAEHASHLKHLAKPKPMRPEPIDLVALVRTAVRLLEVAGILRGVTVSFDVPAELVGVADRSSLEGVVVNIVKNAAEAIRERAEAEEFDSPWRGAIRVTVRAASDTMVAIAIEDNGIGMSEATRARVFDQFFSTKASKGTGLGLAIAWKTLEEAGGSIAVESELGRFARFSLLLPRPAAPS